MINLECCLLIVQSSGRAKWAEDFFEAAFFTSQTIWDLMCFFKNDLNPLQRGHCNDAECTFSGQFAAPSHHHRA